MADMEDLLYRDTLHVPVHGLAVIFRYRAVIFRYRAIIFRYRAVIFRYRVTEGGHCQGACCPQWVFVIATQCQWDGTTIYVVMGATRDIHSPSLKREKQICTGLSCSRLQTWAAGMRSDVHATTVLLTLFQGPKGKKGSEQAYHTNS